jgi:hypothetical protein
MQHFIGGFFCVLYSTPIHLPPLRSNPGLLHWQLDALTTRLDLIRKRLDLIRSRLNIIRMQHFRLAGYIPKKEKEKVS